MKGKATWRHLALVFLAGASLAMMWQGQAANVESVHAPAQETGRPRNR